jgi:hypothetical protein
MYPVELADNNVICFKKVWAIIVRNVIFRTQRFGIFLEKTIIKNRVATQDSE